MEVNLSFVTRSAVLAVDVISPNERWGKQKDRGLARTRALLEGLCDGGNLSCAVNYICLIILLKLVFL